MDRNLQPPPKKVCRLVPNQCNQFCLEIYLDSLNNLNDNNSINKLLLDQSFSLEFDSEFSREFFEPIPEQLKVILSKVLSSLKTDRAYLNINNIKIFAKSSLVLIIPVYILLNTAPLNALDNKYSMTYLYTGTNTQRISYISQTQKSLNTVAPNYFTCDDNGGLIVSGISADFIAYAHGQGLKVVPYLSNGWDRNQGQKALENKEELANDLAQAVIDNNLDGVNVDLEALTENDRDQYTELIKLLNDILPEDKEISVAVAANPSNWTQGWQASYDYTNMAKYADYLMLMAYDEHYGGSAPGPVASIGFVEKSIQYALTKTSPEKIVLGLPFYGRIWSTDNGNIAGRGLTLLNIRTIINNYSAVTGYSSVYQSPYARFSVSVGDPVVSYNGTALKPGSYIIWYENSDSLKKKLALVQKYDLKGAGSWSLGQETPDVWNYYSLWLNGKYFSDINNSFAKDAIVKAASLGLMTGISENRFGPAEALTRAQAAAIFCRALKLSSSGQEAPFGDIHNHWAEYEINAAYEAGLITGYDDGNFHPNDKMTREEVAVLLARITDLSSLTEETSPPRFSDIAKDRWSYQEITALADAQILRGYEDGTFAPAKVLNREEMAALLERIEDYLP